MIKDLLIATWTERQRQAMQFELQPYDRIRHYLRTMKYGQFRVNDLSRLLHVSPYAVRIIARDLCIDFDSEIWIFNLGGNDEIN
jgi:Mn-dependent DtxR family transcriptional regulator